jgi:C-terminal processing protease CtpA/Prc
MTVPDLVLTLSLLKRGTLADPYLAGAIGSEVLRRFTVTFDYERREMILEKNANYNSPDVFDRSGMYLNKGAAWFEVLEVVAGGPADEAGVKVGDRILSVDGMNASQWTLPKLRLKLKGSVRSRVNVTITRKGQMLQLTVVLRDLV